MSCDEAQQNYGSNSQVAASCESIVDTTMQDADFGVKRVAPQ
jgi:hypothetical protein